MNAARAMAALALGWALVGAQPASPPVSDAPIVGAGYPRKLSEFGFFSGQGVSLPSPSLAGYTLRTPLFSDYAQKQRFIYVPGGAKIAADDAGVLEFPVGTALIKTFGYGQGPAFRPIETRVLLRRAGGWEALPYVWNADLTDADLKLAGTRVPVTVTKPSGERVAISYAVPNKNQCKECHARAGQVMPIGPVAANMDFASGTGEALRRRIAWASAPVHAKGPVWDDAKTGSLDSRARAYLATNCAHCHNPQGSASNSGLFLNPAMAGNAVATGIYKRPVAAGRGSGGHDFAIAPGAPAQSIMIHRMSSTEPGVAMPEVGRSMVHDEGVALIREWISSLPAK